MYNKYSVIAENNKRNVKTDSKGKYLGVFTNKNKPESTNQDSLIIEETDPIKIHKIEIISDI